MAVVIVLSDSDLRDVGAMPRISPGQIDLERVRSLATDPELGPILDRVLESIG